MPQLKEKERKGLAGATAAHVCVCVEEAEREDWVILLGMWEEARTEESTLFKNTRAAPALSHFISAVLKSKSKLLCKTVFSWAHWGTAKLKHIEHRLVA